MVLVIWIRSLSFIDQDSIKVLLESGAVENSPSRSDRRRVLQRNIPAQKHYSGQFFESMRFQHPYCRNAYDYIVKAEGRTGKIYILLDEIREVERWQIAITFVSIFDCDIYLTGSNSKSSEELSPFSDDKALRSRFPT